MEGKIQLTLQQIKEMLPVALARGTELAYISLLTQWAEQANEYISKLEKPDFQRQLTLF